MRYLNVARTSFTYQSRGGETALVRCEIRQVTPETVGFSSSTAERVIVEAVFVSCDDADLACWIIKTAGEHLAITDLLDVHHITYRYPSNTATASVTELPERTAIEHPTEHVA